MVAINRLGGAVVQVAERARFGVRKEGGDVAVEPGLIAFQTQDIVRALLLDEARDRGLAPHRVNRDDAAGQGEDLQPFGDRHDFIRFRLGLDLAETQALARRPRADDVNRGLIGGRVKGAAQRLPVHRDHVAGQMVGHRVHPRQNSGLEPLGVQRRADATKGLVGRHAVPRRQKAAKPLSFGAAEVGDRHPIVRAADRRAQRDDENIDEGMPARASDARIGQRPEMISSLSRRTSGHDTSNVSSQVRHIANLCGRARESA
jgi:hypothetical protein